MISIKNSIKTLLLFVLITCKYEVFAVTSGPTQPEVQQFTPIGAADMVDLFSGNFMYNIPLFELPGPNGGYPFNIGYRSGITMDQEATWVGLGWNLHVGSINRQMRTLPDEFNGIEKLIKTNDQLENTTIGVGLAFDVEFAVKVKKEKILLSWHQAMELVCILIAIKELDLHRALDWGLHLGLPVLL